MFVFDQDKPVFVEEAVAEFGGAKFTVSQASNPKFQRIFTALQKPHRRKIERGEMDPAESTAIAIKAMAQGILLDWTGVKTSTGEDVPYSQDTAIKLLTARPDLREFLQEFAIDMENFRAENLAQMGEQ